jgi:hypothetical protein
MNERMNECFIALGRPSCPWWPCPWWNVPRRTLILYPPNARVSKGHESKNNSYLEDRCMILKLMYDPGVFWRLASVGIQLSATSKSWSVCENAYTNAPSEMRPTGHDATPTWPLNERRSIFLAISLRPFVKGLAFPFAKEIWFAVYAPVHSSEYSRLFTAWRGGEEAGPVVFVWYFGYDRVSPTAVFWWHRRTSGTQVLMDDLLSPHLWLCMVGDDESGFWGPYGTLQYVPQRILILIQLWVVASMLY